MIQIMTAVRDYLEAERVSGNLPGVSSVKLYDDLLEPSSAYPLVTVDWESETFLGQPDARVGCVLRVSAYVVSATKGRSPQEHLSEIYQPSDSTKGLRAVLLGFPPRGFAFFPREARKVSRKERGNAFFTVGLSVVCEVKTLVRR